MLAGTFATKAPVDREPADEGCWDAGILGELPGYVLGPRADIDTQGRERVVAKDCVAFAFTQNKRGSDVLARVG